MKRWKYWIQRLLIRMMFMRHLGECRCVICLLHESLRNSRRRWGETWLDVCGVGRDDVSYREFKSLPNKVQSWIRTAKSNYYLAIFNQSDNPANTWKYHHSVICDLLREKTRWYFFFILLMIWIISLCSLLLTSTQRMSLEIQTALTTVTSIGIILRHWWFIMCFVKIDQMQDSWLRQCNLNW